MAEVGSQNQDTPRETDSRTWGFVFILHSNQRVVSVRGSGLAGNKNEIKLTREDTATNGDISGKGAFLVNVGAINSLREGGKSTYNQTRTYSSIKHLCASHMHQQCQKALSSKPRGLRRPSWDKTSCAAFDSSTDWLVGCPNLTLPLLGFWSPARRFCGSGGAFPWPPCHLR